MTIPPIGLYDTQIQQAFTTQLTNVETKGTSPTMRSTTHSTRSSRSPLRDHRRRLLRVAARSRLVRDER
jgi:hypothetical protein